jgi:hypothetical protein
MSIPALEVERFEELCRTISLFLKPDDALDVLSLMALAAPPPPEISPVDMAIGRLGTLLDIDVWQDRKDAVPFDWEIHGKLS